MSTRAQERKQDVRRGRHKKLSSPETKIFEREHLIPGRPEWMDGATYLELAALRRELA